MDIAVVDYTKPSAEKEFVNSIEHTGFCVLRNHPVSADLIAQAFAEWQTFFSLPEEAKRQHLFQRDFDKVQGGFFPQEVSETAKGFSAKDIKEFYHYYPCAGKLPECVGEPTQSLRRELIEMAKNLLVWLEKGLPEEIRTKLSTPLVKMVDEEYQTLLRILHYPPLPKEIPEGSVRGAPHEDINLITLLVSPSTPGLQSLDKSGEWKDVPCDKNWIAVNIGDMLQECTGGYYTSTKHQVVNPVGEASQTSRYSMPLFLHPKDEVKLSSRYTAREYLNERLRELGLL